MVPKWFILKFLSDKKMETIIFLTLGTKNRTESAKHIRTLIPHKTKLGIRSHLCGALFSNN